MPDDLRRLLGDEVVLSTLQDRRPCINQRAVHSQLAEAERAWPHRRQGEGGSRDVWPAAGELRVLRDAEADDSFGLAANAASFPGSGHA
jgi:hypothetical protein